MYSASPADSTPCKPKTGGETTQNVKTESVKREIAHQTCASSAVRLVREGLGR